MSESLRLSFYGDDFTGSTDVMESLSFNGTPAALFLEVPTKEEVLNFRLKNGAISTDRKLKAFGVPGVGRSLTPEQMDEQLPEIFEGLSKIPASYFHYKVCSTFDSSPVIGSIGHAVEIALRYFPSTYIPLVVGIPLLNRFCVFGNLFASVNGTTYRLDEHPTMSRHPITPMREANLKKHLGEQTNRPIRLMDVMSLESDENAESSRLFKDEGYILFDVLQQKHLAHIGSLIAQEHIHPHQLLVGSSGVEYALLDHWNKGEDTRASETKNLMQRSQQFIVIAGSCSPRTAEQIRYGIEIGFEAVVLDSIKLIEDNETEVMRCSKLCVKALVEGKAPILYTAMGPEDPSIDATKRALSNSGIAISVGALLGGAQGRILKNVIDKVGRLRIAVAGGDTSGYVTKTLGIYALEALARIAPGAPLCIAHAKNLSYDGLEICLKGGQNGSERFFESVWLGRNEYDG